METVFRVAALDCIKRDLSFYVKEKAIKPTAASNLIIAQNRLIKNMSENIEDLMKLLNVPDDILQAPLAGDYEGYFSQPNFGEVVAARLWLKKRAEDLYFKSFETNFFLIFTLI